MIIGYLILGVMFIIFCAIISESIIRDVKKGKF